MAQVTVRYFASVREAAGVVQESVDAVTLADLLSDLRARHNPRFTRILDVSSLLLDGVRVSDPSISLGAGAGVDVLPPFAGG